MAKTFAVNKEGKGFGIEVVRGYHVNIIAAYHKAWITTFLDARTIIERVLPFGKIYRNCGVEVRAVNHVRHGIVYIFDTGWPKVPEIRIPRSKLLSAIRRQKRREEKIHELAVLSYLL